MTARRVAYPPEAVLTPDEVAEWLAISERQLERLPIRRVQLSPRKTLYLAREVYEYLEERVA